VGVVILAILTYLKNKQKYFLSLQMELFVHAKLTEAAFSSCFRFGKKTPSIKVLRVYFS